MGPGRGSPWGRRQKPLMSHLKLSRTKSSRRNDPTQPASRGQNELMGCGARVRVCMCRGWGERTLVLTQLGLGSCSLQGLHRSPLPTWSGCPLQVGEGRAQDLGWHPHLASWSSIFIQHPSQHLGEHPDPVPSSSILVLQPHPASWSSILI